VEFVVDAEDGKVSAVFVADDGVGIVAVAFYFFFCGWVVES